MNNESIKENKLRMSLIIDILSKDYPDAKIQLNYSKPFELLVATILSAQCTDARVNIVTEKLFKKHLTIEDYINVPILEFEQDIFSTGFYKAKAKNIKATASLILNKYNGEVPSTMEELIKLPGVGRKTANVLLGHCFNTPGIVVDTHVIRITNLLCFIDTQDAEKIEFELMKIIPKDKWTIFTHYLILHGRAVCVARKPKCYDCNIAKLCPSAVIA